MMSFIEKLKDNYITDDRGHIIGVLPPNESQIAEKVNEMIDAFNNHMNDELIERLNREIKGDKE